MSVITQWAILILRGYRASILASVSVHINLIFDVKLVATPVLLIFNCAKSLSLLRGPKLPGMQ